jgi:hypothetical protein
MLAIKKDGSKDLSKDLSQKKRNLKHINLPKRGTVCRAKAQVGVRVASAFMYGKNRHIMLYYPLL